MTHKARVAGNSFRIPLTLLGQSPEGAVVVQQTAPQRRRMHQREQHPLFIIEVCADLATPRVQKPGDRANAARTILVRGLPQTPGMDEPTHVLAGQWLERRVTFQRLRGGGQRGRLLGVVVRHRAIVFSMCAPPTLNILGPRPATTSMNPSAC